MNLAKQLEYSFKQLFLNLLLLVGKRNKKAVNTDLPNFKGKKIKILLIRLNRIGDALVATPLIKLIKENLDCEIEILADKKNHFIFINNPFIKKTIIYQKGIKGILGLIKYINASKFDVIVDLHDDVSTTVSYIMAVSKTTYKFGLNKNNNIIYTNTIERMDGATNHVIIRNMQISKLFGIHPEYEKANINYFPIKASKEFISNYLQINFEKERMTVGVNISAGSKARFWGIERFKKLFEFISKFDVNIIIICPPKDLELAKNISNKKYKIFSEPEFDLAAALISKLNILFTPDTSLVHIASAYNVPVFGLYVKYKTEDLIWYPYKSPYEAIITKEANLNNLRYSKVIREFEPFFENIYKNYQKEPA